MNRLERIWVKRMKRGPMDAVDKARGEFHAALRKRDAAHGRVREKIGHVKDAVRHVLGRRSIDLLAFGFKPERPRRKLTREEKANAAAKARATREANGTNRRRGRRATP